MNRRIPLVLALALTSAACNDEPTPAPPTTSPVKPQSRGAAAGRGPASTGAPGEVPSEELGRGAAAVRLTIADAETGKVTAGRVRLWRLGLAESFTSTAGDQIQAYADVPTAGVHLRDLPTGRYRIECVSQGRTRPDPPAFELGEVEFQLDVVVHPLARVAVRAAIFRPDGSQIDEVDRGIPGKDPNSRRRWAPAWAKPRRSRSSSGAGAPRRRADSSVTARLVAAADGFDLGAWQEVPHDADEVDVVRLLAGPEWQQVHVATDAVLGVPTTFVAVVAPTKDLVAGVTTNESESPLRADIEAGTESWSEAVAFPSPPPTDAWRGVPIHVTVRVAGYETLDFDWTVAASSRPRVLVAKSSK